MGQLYIGSRPSKRRKSQEIKNLRAIPWVFAWTQIRLLLPAWLGMTEAIEVASKGGNRLILKQMLNKWPFFYEMMDMLDMVLIKTDTRVIEFYEECLGNQKHRNTGAKIRNNLSSLKNLNKKLIPKHILNQRKEFRKSIMLRDTYAEILNLLQADIMKKLNKNKLNKNNQQQLMDAIGVTIAGISAAMKNTG